MTQPPTVIEEVTQKEDGWWRSLIKPFSKSFKNDCNLESVELGIEAMFATFLLTKFVFKRPQSTFNYSVAAFMIVPLVNWPFCVAKKKAALIPKEL